MAMKLAPNAFDFPVFDETPDPPDAGYVRVYSKDDNKMYQQDSAGTETELGGGTTDLVADTLTLNDWSELTIASGAITVTHTLHLVDTEADASSDDLDTVNGLGIGEICIIRQVASTRDVTVKNNTGNILCVSSTDLPLSNETQAIVFIGHDDGTHVLAYPLGWGYITVHASTGTDLTVNLNTTLNILASTGISTSNAGMPLGTKISVVTELITGRTEDTTPDLEADFLLTYDDSASAFKKSTPRSLAFPYVADGIKFTNPTAQTWNDLNHGAGTYTEDTTNKRLVILEDGNGTIQVRGWYFTAPDPSTDPYVATFYVQQQANFVTNNGACVFHRQNSTGELRTVAWRSDGTNLSFAVTNWNSATSLNANTVTNARFITEPRWFQIEDNNTDVFYRVSPDGIVWHTLYTIARTTFLTPDELGFGVFLQTASTYDATASLLSLELT